MTVHHGVAHFMVGELVPLHLVRTRFFFLQLGHDPFHRHFQDSDTIQKISIIPRGIAALGYTLQLPTEDRFLMTKRSWRTRLPSYRRADCGRIDLRRGVYGSAERPGQGHGYCQEHDQVLRDERQAGDRHARS